MFQEFGDIKNGIKEVVNPLAVKKEITSSWSDFWNLELTSVEGGDKVTLGIVIIAIVCFVIGIVIAKWLSSRVVKRFFSRFEMSPNSLHLWSSIIFYTSSIFVSIVALKIAHVPLTVFTLLGGALALGIGFGSKNLVNNFISGVMFMFEGPAKMGDFVEVDGYFGRVVDVGLRATHLEIGLTKRAIVPNSSFLEKTIVNWGKAGSPIYLAMSVSVNYGDNLKKIEEILLTAPIGVSQVIEGLPCRVLLKSFADSGIVLDLMFPVQIYSPGDRDIVASHVRKKVELLFAKENIAMPYPQVVFHQASLVGQGTAPKL